MEVARLFLSFVTALFTIGANCYSQHASFQGLGDLPGGAFESAALGVSADGLVVVGSGMTAHGKSGFRWTQASGIVEISDTSMKACWCYNTSRDGSIVVGSGDAGSGWNSYRGFYWTKEGGITFPEHFHDRARFEMWGVSADGSVIVGDGGQQAFLWNRNSAATSLGVLPGRTSSRAVSVSADGSVSVGSSYNLPGWDHEEAFAWTKGRGMVGLGFFPRSNYSFAIAVSPDGAVVLGTSSDSSGYPAFRWTESSGMVRLGHLPGRNTTHPFAADSNGTIIVGTSFMTRGQGTAFIWDNKHGMRGLQAVLTDVFGLDMVGWELQSTTGISSDGTVIVGWGKNPSGSQEAFLIVLNPRYL
jgi:probable HAF family extracellular repeat protein